jgi:hypothetical protein
VGPLKFPKALHAIQPLGYKTRVVVIPKLQKIDEGSSVIGGLFFYLASYLVVFSPSTELILTDRQSFPAQNVRFQSVNILAI